MQAPVLYIPLAIEWVILITAFMPRLLVGMFYNIPKFGLALWFTYFASTVLAAAAAIGITLWALIELVQRIWGGGSIEVKLLEHFGMWILVAISGIAISLLNLKTEPHIVEANLAKKALASASRKTGEFQDVATYQIVFPVPLAFVGKLLGKQAIVVSDSATLELSKAELEALYWHELGHIRGRHNLVLSIAKGVALFTPVLKASQLFTAETAHLTEIIADNFAKKHVPAEVLESARVKFLE